MVRLEPDGLAVEPQLFINIDSSKPSLKPLLGNQLLFLNCRSRTCCNVLFFSQLTCNPRRTEVESFRHQRRHIALVSQSSFYLAAQPIRRLLATFQRGGGERDKKMGTCGYVSKDDALKVPTHDTVVIDKDIIAVRSQVLEIASAQGMLVRR
jgi:hypothetical protein